MSTINYAGVEDLAVAPDSSLTTDHNGNVYYFGGAVNRVHIYQLTGWDTIARQNGTVVKN